jgi:hypothetical protein
MRLLPPARVVLVAVVTCVATPAYAQWTRHHGSECVPQVPPSLDRFAVVLGGATNADPAWGMDTVCASDDSDAYPDSAISEVRLYLYDASPTDSIVVQVCVATRDFQGIGLCSTREHTTTDSFVGPFVMTLSGDDLDLWRQKHDFGYFKIWVPAKVGTAGFSFVKGWITQQ